MTPALAVEQPVHRRAIRRDDELVERDPERAALLLGDADDVVRDSAQSDRVADRVDGGEEVILDVLPDDHDQRTPDSSSWVVNTRPLTTPRLRMVK